MKRLTRKEVTELYRKEANRNNANVFESSGDDKNAKRNQYLAAIDYAGEELSICDTDKKRIEAIYRANLTISE
jgi:hypothetical protein